MVPASQRGDNSEARYSSEVQGNRRAVRVRGDLEDPVDQGRASPGNLLAVPPVLHRPPETDRHRGPRGTVHEEVRRADVGKPQVGGQGQEGDPEGPRAGQSRPDRITGRALGVLETQDPEWRMKEAGRPPSSFSIFVFSAPAPASTPACCEVPHPLDHVESRY